MSNHDIYWQAVEDRNKQFDGVFVLAVRTTGIYCRPSCPARRPNRENVTFFDQPTAAEHAGFRACKRCHPQDAVADPQVAFVIAACAYIESHIDTALTLADISAHVSVSPYHLQRTFKRIMGISPRQYADAQRLKQFKQSLQECDTVTCAMYDAGYSSSSRLYERAGEQLGMTPSAYKRGGEGMHIAYTICDSEMGRVLIGVTGRGVASVCLGEDDAAVETCLRKEYPAAELHRDQLELCPWVDAVLDQIHGWKPRADLPLDVQATAFQWRVWEQLQNIPAGDTRSYRDIAEAIGQPTATRAVANACASNPVAVVIPCHRVVRTDGELGGYKWGIERKQALLEHERAVALQISD